ncbi:MAG: Transcriptional regulator of nonfermentable carbon utilization [Caeruleum heppii]|nr:MAG: Transcriptional regulator of nonfermentable carbon utilization [Caeruleum heppii]
MRKKAKYLHDAPNEALMPGLISGQYGPAETFRVTTNLPGNMAMNDPSGRVGPPAEFFQQPQAGPNAAFGMYPDNGGPSQLPPNLSEFRHNQPPLGPELQTSTSNQVASGQMSLSQESPVIQDITSAPFDNTLFDVGADPSLFNFDLASLNFGNHYGALEFGMLGHMSSGAVSDAPDMTSGSGGASMGAALPLFATSSASPSGYVQSPPAAGFTFNRGSSMAEWPSGTGDIYTSHDGDAAHPRGNPSLAHGYTIRTNPSSMASPSTSSSPQGYLTGFDGSQMSPQYYSPPFHQTQQTPMELHPPRDRHYREESMVTKAVDPHMHRRPRDPSAIYDSVKDPYSYTTGFHGLTAFLQKRFSRQKTLRIAKALASIRPSFISCTKTLNRDDLIFMEKCFQRTLWEYEDFINACGTPTLVCRRTGEVAAVGKEFSILTGWKKDVLLGKEVNRNVNTGGSSGSASGSAGNTTPVARQVGQDGNGRPQPVFLAELLDDDSVIEFYEDFAKLAFGDSRGSVTTRCKLLKYHTKDEQGRGPTSRQGGNAMSGLGSSDGKVECSYCWTVKRDVFDIPMLIVMNFLPCT